ncbi:MAG: hypothetical protein WA156_12025 [Methylocystis silviterrae]
MAWGAGRYQSGHVCHNQTGPLPQAVLFLLVLFGIDEMILNHRQIAWPDSAIHRACRRARSDWQKGRGGGFSSSSFRRSGQRNQDRDMTDTDTQIFLSAEEQAALAEPDDAAPAAATVANADLAASDDGDAGREEVYQPLLQVREIPQDREALQALDDHESDLQTKFDEGEITSGELASGLREIQSHRNEITWALRKNELAVEMQQTREDEAWNKAVRSFMSNEGATIGKNEALATAFDSIVRKVTADPANVNLSFRKQLEKAHKLFNADVARAGFSFDGSFDGSAMASGSANFAALDRLADTNPAKFEKAFAALSSDEQSAYLES